MTAVVPTGNAVSVNVTETFGEVAALRPQWEALFDCRGHEPSTSYDWTAAMIRHKARPGDRAFLVRLEREGTLVGIIPLVLRSFAVLGQNVSLLAPLSEDYNTHSDLLLQSLDDDIVQAVVSTLFARRAEWDCFRMARLLADNPLVPALRRSLAARQHAHAVRDGLSAYVLDLPNSYDAYLAARSAKFRSHLKRAERKLAGGGHLEVRELTDAGDFDAAFAAVLQVERTSWKHSFGSAITAVAHQPGFYQDFGREALGAGRLHLQWLTLNDRPIAYNLGYLTRAGYHYLKTSYDHEFRPMGPATVLRARLIESLIASRVPRLDFPGEPYEWETQWTDRFRRRVVLTVYRETIRGRLLALGDRIRHRDGGQAGVAHVDPRQPHQRAQCH
jgi:CelD/BcsL family acetyltransferase involved in cellulose biosynthesis